MSTSSAQAAGGLHATPSEIELQDTQRNTGFDDTQIEVLRRHFDQLDLNGDGHLTASELYLMFKALKVPVTDETLQELIAAGDKDGNGEIEFNEFVYLVASLRQTNNETWLMLLKATKPSALQRVQTTTARFFGVHDHEVERRDVAVRQGTSFFDRRDVVTPNRRRPDPLTAAVKRTGTFKKLSSRMQGTNSSNALDASPREYDAAKDPAVRKALAEQISWTPWFLLSVTLAQIALVIASIVINQGLAPMSLNYMAGPSSLVLLQLGARYSPCMRADPVNALTYTTACAGLPNFPTSQLINGTYCSYYTYLSEICGMGGFRSGVPDQWWRFIVPIFLNVGIIQLFINSVFQVWRGFQIEQEIGPFRMAIIYLGSGIFGIALGANNTPSQLAVGSTASMYSFLALLFLDLFMNWPLVLTPYKDLAVLVIVFLITLALGLIPYIDLFESLGAFVCGIVLGIIFVPHLNFGYWDAIRKKIAIAVAVPCFFIMYFLVFWYFYRITTYECHWCIIIQSDFNVFPV